MVPEFQRASKLQRASTVQAFAFDIFSNVPCAEVSHIVKPNFKGIENRLCLLMGRASKSYFKGVCIQDGKSFGLQ